MVRRLFVIVVVLAAIALTPATASGQAITEHDIVVSFTAGLGVGTSVYPPFSPQCGAAPCPGANTTYVFSTANPGFAGQRICMGDGTGGPGWNINGTQVFNPCTAASTGTFGPAVAAGGAWCGLARGRGTMSMTVGTEIVAGASVDWTWLPDGSVTFIVSGAATGGGTGRMAAAGGPTCGTGPSSSFAIEVTLTLHWTT